MDGVSKESTARSRRSASHPSRMMSHPGRAKACHCVYTLLLSCVCCWWRVEALRLLNYANAGVLGALWVGPAWDNRSKCVCVCAKFQHFTASAASGVMTCASLHVNSGAIHLQVNLQRAIPVLAARQRCVFMTR